MGIAIAIRSAGFFLRRRDLLARGFNDHAIRAALAAHLIFRVRHGWYSVPDAPEPAIRAVRVGGRLTSVSALESYGLPVPRSAVLHVAVAPTSCRLRSYADRRVRLSGGEPVRVHWHDGRSSGTVWRVPIDDALVAAIATLPRDVAVACASAVMRRKRWGWSRLDAVFARVPERCRGWRRLVSRLDDSHGETYFRLWTADRGIPCEQQVQVSGVGRLDFRMGPRTWVEVDGAQHDPDWVGEHPSSWEGDHDRDATMAIDGHLVLRFTYRQLYADWPRVLAAVERAIADGNALEAYRARRPFRPRVLRKRRRSREKAP
jgi:very-short-patch-repair endonuclease